MLSNSSKVLILGFIFLSSSLSYAQYTNLINSNRPGSSQGAFAVGVNVIQFETGLVKIKEERIPQASYNLERLRS